MTAPPMKPGSPHGHGGYARGCRCEMCREAHNAYSRVRYRSGGREKTRRDTARWQKTEKGRRYHAERERLRKFEGDTKDYATILLVDPCSYCGGLAEAVDHIEPVASGGQNDWPNLTAACRGCNSRKGTRPLLAVMHENML